MCYWNIIIYTQILEKMGLRDQYFPLVKKWVIEAVIPNHKEIMLLGSSDDHRQQHVNTVSSKHEEEVDEEMKLLIHEIVQTAASHPKNVQ